MAELKRTFLQGKMEADLDDRLVQKGTYRFGQNVSVSRSTTSDVGALENVRGNRQIPTEFPLSSTYVSVGSVSDELNDKIYWFFIGPTTEGIYEYDIENDSINRVLEFSRDKRVLEFSTQNFITGANIIGNQLLWTDNLKPPRQMNISRFVSSPVLLDNGQTVNQGAGTYYAPNNQGQYHPFRQTALVIQESGNAGNPETTDGQTVIPLRDIPSFADNVVVENVRINEIPLDESETDDMGVVTVNWTVDIVARTLTLSAANALEADDFIVLAIDYVNQTGSDRVDPSADNAELLSTIDPEYDNNGIPLVDISFEVGVDSENIRPAFHGDLINVAKRPPLFPPDITTPERTVETVPAQSGDFLYDNFLYFAYRYTYRDGQQTPLSPFAGPSFFPKPFEEDRESGGIPSMVNQASQALLTYDVGDIEVTEIELVVTSSRDITVKSLAIINKEESGLSSSTPYERNLQTFTYDNNKVYSTLPASELFRLYDNVPLRAQSQEIVGNRLVYGNYVQNYNLIKLNGDAIIPDFTIGYNSTPISSGLTSAACSVKSDRDYQVGIVYLDREGRQSPVLLSDGTNGNSSIKIPFNDPQRAGRTHTNKNTLNVTINSAAPVWATHYRFFIKQVQGQYYNVLPKDTSASGGKIYLQLDSDDRNKIDSETEFIIKGDSNEGPRDQRSLWRVDPYIVGTNGESSFGVETTEGGGFQVTSSARDALSFNVPYDDVQERTDNAFGTLIPSEVTVTVNTGDLSIQGDRPFITIPDISENTLVSVKRVVRADGSELLQYQEDRGRIAPNYIIGNGGVLNIGLSTENTYSNNQYSAPTTTPALDDDEDVTISYTIQVLDPKSPAKNDFYISIVPLNGADNEVVLDKDEGLILETVPTFEMVADIYYEHGETFRCVNGAHTSFREGVLKESDICQELYGEDDILPVGKAVGDPVEGDNGIVEVELNKYFNCFTYPVGIEETTIEGKFNNVSLLPGIKASTTNEAYRERLQSSNLIHSGIYNDDISLNRLNEFNPGLPITTEIDIADGSIQKLHARDTNLIVFQEDKTKNVPIQKNLIQTAGGGNGLSISSQFFGTEFAYEGEWGISRNPESFCTYGSRIYFADKNRGALLRLAGNRIDEISQAGMESYIRNTLNDAELVVGSYDHFHDQAHFSFRNRPEVIQLNPNELVIPLSEDGRPGPRSECNRNQTLITFKPRYAYVSNSAMGIQVGDVIFVDINHTYQFNGNYRWFRIQDPEGTDPDRWNRAIQLSPDGVVTGVEDNCAINQPPDLPRDSFDISINGFSSEYEACGNGVVDGQAYHDGVGNEPIIGDIIYEGRWDRIRSSRTGWFIISNDVMRDVILLCNGEVMDRVTCAEISRGRRAILGSNPQGFLEGTQEVVIIDEVCTEPFAEQLYWYEGEGDLPGAGMELFINNHSDVLATPDRYYTFPQGYYVKLDSESVIETGYPRLCSELLCYVNPENLVSQTGLFDFEFQGVDRVFYLTTAGREVVEYNTTQPARNVEIEYIVQGESRYPRTGTFKTNTEVGTGVDKTYGYDFRVTDENRYLRLDGDVVNPLILGTVDSQGDYVAETITLPAPNDSVDLSEAPYGDYNNEDPNEIRVIVTKLCYRIPIQTVVGAEVIAATPPVAAITGSIVSLTGGEAVPLSATSSIGGLFRGGAVAGISSYSWTIGGTEVSTETIYDLPSRTTPGDTVITLTIQSANGQTDTDTHTVTFSDAPPDEFTFEAILADNHNNAVVIGNFPTINGIDGVATVINRTLEVMPQVGFQWTGTAISITAAPGLPPGLSFSTPATPSNGTNETISATLTGNWTPSQDYEGTFTWSIAAGAIEAIPDDSVTGTPAWLTTAISASDVANGDFTICGNVANDAVYYNADNLPNIQYFEDAGLTVPFSSGAGSYGNGVAMREEGGAIVTRVQAISANGTVTSTIACVGNNDTYAYMLGFTPANDDLEIQIACGQGLAMTSDQVLVYADQPRTNFSDDEPDDGTNPGNPPDRFTNADGSHVTNGFYTDGTTVRQVTNGVVGGKRANGCSLSRTATLSVTNDIVTPNSAVPRIVLMTDQGTSLTWSTNPASLTDPGEIGDDWSFTTSVAAPVADLVATNGYTFSDGPFMSIDGGAAVAVSNGVVPWSGTFVQAHINNPPSQTLRLTGTVTANNVPPPPLTHYTISFTLTGGISNATTEAPVFSNHTFTRVGSSNTWISQAIPIAQSGSISVSVSANTNYVFASNSPTFNGSFTGSNTGTVNYSSAGRTNDSPQGEATIAVSGTTIFVQPAQTYTLTGTTDNANTSVNSPRSRTESIPGNYELTLTLSVNTGWDPSTLVSTPGGTTQNASFTFPTTTRTAVRSWTNVSVERYSHTLTEVTSASATQNAQCETGSSVTIFTDTPTAYSGSRFAAATSASSVSGTRYFRDGTTVYTHSGTSWTTTTCTNEPARTTQSYNAASSLDGACSSSTSTATTLFLSTDGTWYTGDVGSFTRPSTSQFFGIGTTVYTFSSTGVRSGGTLCPGVYVNGSLRPTGAVLITNTGNTTQAITVTLVGISSATFTGGGGINGQGTSNNVRQYTVTMTANGNNSTSIRDFQMGAPISSSDSVFVYSPSSVTVPFQAGSFGVSLTNAFTNVFGASRLTVTY